MSEPVYILAGTSHEYTLARRKLDLSPSQAFWLTSPANLTGKQKPKVYRCENWKALLKAGEIETVLTEIEAEVIDLS